LGGFGFPRWKVVPARYASSVVPAVLSRTNRAPSSFSFAGGMGAGLRRTNPSANAPHNAKKLRITMVVVVLFMCLSRFFRERVV
jgi:hypothetical protein